jgi:putative hemolysin
LGVLILLSGFFSASETALTAFNRSKLSEVEEKMKGSSKLLKIWLLKPNKMLTAILIGNNVVNILSSAIATTLAINLVGSGSNAIMMVTASMTVIILIFGEITPKIIAKTYSTIIAALVIRIIYFLSLLFSWLIAILMFISKIIARLFNIKITDENLIITEEDIKSFVIAGEEEGVIEEEEREMIHSIFEFGEARVRDVMVPRTTIYTIEASKTLNDIWDEIIENGFSRIPVYEESIDNVIGIIYVKDLFNVIRDGKFEVEVRNFIREPYFVPETKPLVEMLEEFKNKHVHIAIVVDEYGGTSGLVTIEDLIEEIVGEINDEFDEEEDNSIRKVAENKYIIDALLPISDINSDLGINLLKSEDYDTLGGYVYSALGRVPVEKDTIVDDELGIELRVLEVDNRRVVKVLITKKEV